MKSLRLMSMVGVLFFTFLGFGRTYYIPHIHTGSDVWETYLVAENEDSNNAHSFSMTLYAADGSVVLDSRAYTVSAGTQTLVSLRAFGGVDGEVECGSNFMRFRVTYKAGEDSGGGTAEFELPSTLKQVAVFSPSVYLGDMTWSGFAVMNGGEETATVVVNLLKTDGSHISWGTLTIPPHGKVVNYFEDAFGVPMDQLTSVVMRTDQKALAGITITGKENDKLLFTPVGTSGNGWNYSSKSYGTVYGVAAGTENDFVLERVPLGLKGATSSLYLMAVNHYTGDIVGKETILSREYYPYGMASSPDGAVVIIYGVYYEDFNNRDYFVSRVNTAGAAILWTKHLDANQFSVFTIDGNFNVRIVAASSGNTIEVVLVDESSYEVRYLLNPSDGSQIDRKVFSTPTSRIPTALVYDTGYSIYAGLGTALDDGSLKNGGTGMYSHIYLFTNNDTSLTGTSTIWDASGIISDSALHHVFVAGATAFAGDLYFVMMASVGEAINGGGISTGFAMQPAQVVAAHVSLDSLNPAILNPVKTTVTGMLMQRALCVVDGTGGAIAIFPGLYPYSGSSLFRFDTVLSDDGFNSFWPLAALSYKVDAISFSHGDLLIGAEIPSFSVTSMEKPANYLDFTLGSHTVFAMTSLQDWGTGGFTLDE
ncbi:MAG: hypothetical protein GXO69_00185 [Acidobacteria bacterium]|nr:hypothetical protein [Acidobacteriota bacterium]